MKSILGKKIGMTQVFKDDGRLITVTVIEAGPVSVIQKKEKDKDGYDAIQVGFDVIRKEKNVTKPMMGHFKKNSVSPYRFIKEVRMDGVNAGESVNVDIFSAGDKINVTGTSKGKGFQGVIKRHNFGGGPASHGSMFGRAPGSIGQGADPSRVWKNTKLPGHMGDEKVTVKNLEVIDIRKEQNILLVKGAVPGANGGYLIINSDAPVAVKES